MRAHWETVWEFSTSRFRIVGEATPCQDDPADHFQFPKDVEAVRSERVYWFDARVRVLMDGHELGVDHLGCCAYDEPSDLFRHHASLTKRLRHLRGRTDRRSRRERKSLRACLANNAMLDPPVRYCEYGPDMVRQAISAARKTLATMREVHMREVA